MLSDILLFINFSLLLAFSAFLLVKSLSKIANFLRISEFTAAFIIMALATSIPELFVGISSALSKVPQLSMGNIIGANIIDITLVTGIIILVSKNIKFESKRIGKDMFFMLGAISLLIILYVINESLSRIDGLILISFFGFNMYREFKRKKEYPTKLKGKVGRFTIVLNVFLFIFSILVLLVSSNYVVKYASNLAYELNFPKIVIGLFLLAIATTLPELAFGLSASRLKHKEMAIGDQLGTIITNSTLILGVVSLIHPIKVEFAPFFVSAIFMLVSSLILITFIKSGRKLETTEGISLIFMYILFVIIEFFTKPQI